MMTNWVSDNPHCEPRNIKLNFVVCIGKKILEFSSMTEFNSWKEREEDATYTTYVKNQQAYKPNSSGRFARACSVVKYPSNRDCL
jgi:hypothetical protein